EALAQLVALPDGDDHAVARGDPDVPLHQIDPPEVLAPQRRVVARRARELREPRDHQGALDAVCLVDAHARPSTGMAAPDTSRAVSAQRARIVAASDAGATHFDGSPPCARFCGVSMTLGSTALTRTPASRTSTASASASAM